MKLPHPTEVIAAGRMRARPSPIASRMLTDFLNCSPTQQIEFLFWSLQDMAAHNQQLVAQVNQLVAMLDQAQGKPRQ